jgi:polysaccharide export outer membrane protein
MGEWGSGTIRLPKDQTNIYEALALAGKLSDFGDRARVKIVRQTPLGVKVRSFNLKEKQLFSSEFFWVQPNDVIYIQPIDGKFLGVHSSIYSVIGLVTVVASVTTLVLQLTY